MIMKKLIFYLVLTTHCVFSNFILVNCLYNEMHAGRRQEYIKCLQINLRHSGIDHIHVLYDTIHDHPDGSKNILHSYLKQLESEGRVSITYIQNRPSFGFCFDLVNEFYPDSRIILSNADIYFDHSLHKLHSLDLTNVFLAITRWNVDRHGKIHQFRDKKGPKTSSMDTWIFKTPMKRFKRDTIQLGTLHCDPIIAFRAKVAGLLVYNPSPSIQCCHLHNSGVRHYGGPPQPQESCIAVDWITFENLKKELDIHKGN